MTRLISIPDTQARLGLGRTKVIELADAGEIESVKIGSARRIVEESVEAYIQRILLADALDHPTDGPDPVSTVDSAPGSSDLESTHPEASPLPADAQRHTKPEKT